MTQESSTRVLNPARILIVDDQPLMREALSLHILREDDLAVCGEAAGVQEAIKLVEATVPDLVTVEIALEDGHGLDLIRQIHRNEFGMSVSVLVISMFDETVYARRAWQAGAVGFINKRATSEKMVECIRRVVEGEFCFSDEAREQILLAGGRTAEVSSIDVLTDRELEVLRLIGLGVKTRRIAERLELSHHTIDTYRGNIKRKLYLDDGGELNRFAVEWVTTHPRS